MKSFIAFNILVLAFAIIGQLHSASSESSALGENLVLGYVAYLVYFLYFLTFAMYRIASEKAGRSNIEKIVVCLIMAPYLSLTWRFKYSFLPIFSHEYQVVLSVLIITIWLVYGKKLAISFKHIVELCSGHEKADWLPGKNAIEKLFNMRIVVLVLIALPIPFWKAEAIFG